MLKNIQLEFGPFRVDTSSQLLFCGDKPIPLAPKAYDTLLFLLQNPNRLITREELIKAVWPDTFVEDGNLSVNIFQLRKALGETDEGPPFIETVPRKGYRFTAPVTVVESQPSAGVAGLERPTSSGVRVAGETHAATPFASSRIAAQARKSAVPEIIPFLEKRGPVPAPLEGRADATVRRVRFGRRRIVAIVIAVGAVVAAGSILLRRSMEPSQLAERRLTSFAPEQAVTTAAISTGAKFVAYANRGGIFVQVIATGETHPLALPERNFEVSRISWFPDSASLLVAGSSPAASSPSLWIVPVIGSAPAVRLGDESGGTVSPDGTQIAWVNRASSAPAIEVMSASGEGVRTLVTGEPGETFGRVNWTLDGRRLLFVRYRWDPQFRMNHGSIELCSLKSGRVTNVIAGSDFGGAAVELRGGRIVYTQAPTANPPIQGYNLMAVQTHPGGGATTGPPALLEKWNSPITDLTANASGTQLVLRDEVVQHDVYLASLNAAGSGITDVRRFTFGAGRDDFPRAWTPDERAIFLDSNRNGHWQIFKRPLDAESAVPFIAGPDDQFAPRVSPDRASLLYIERPKSWHESEPARVMRAPLSGGSPEMVLQASRFTDWRLRFDCPRTAGSPCLLAQQGAGEIIFRPFDPAKGFVPGSTSFTIQDPGNGFYWALAPNGSQLAWIADRPAEGVIHVIDLGRSRESFAARGEHDLDVCGRPRLYSIAWAADGRGWFVVSSTRARWTMLHVNSRGGTTEIYQDASDWAPLPFPSPDGRFLAFSKQNTSSNVWLLTGF